MVPLEIFSASGEFFEPVMRVSRAGEIMLSVRAGHKRAGWSSYRWERRLREVELALGGLRRKS